nr:ribonuclease H-like domain-containing protein [Tanacetum cinerariifolium]
MTETRFEDERTTTTIVNPNKLNIAIPDQVLEESILYTPEKVKITSDNYARDQASDVETNVLVDGKQDDAKVVCVAVEQNNDEPNVLEGNRVIGVGVNEINNRLGKSKASTHKPKTVPNSKHRLHLLHMDLCGPMRVESINEKRYVMVIVDDYSRYTWVHFLISKDEAPEEINTFLEKIQVLLQAPVIIVRTDNDTEFKNQLIKEYFDMLASLTKRLLSKLLSKME